VTIRTRAVDDSGNVESTSAGTTVNVGCPCSIWSTTAAPATASSGDASSVEVGVRFSAQVDGYITGVRFFKGPQNVGTHVGSLWTSGGVLLARATFLGETASGWQQVLFDAPVAVTAGATYVASYFAPSGGYAVDLLGFRLATTNPPLTALADGASGANGVFRYASIPSFPTDSYRSSNYWVDVVFTTTRPPDTTPPTVVAVSPSNGATGVDPAGDVTASFSEALDPATVSTASVQLRDASGAAVAASVTYDEGTRTARLDPVADLPPASTFTATVRGGSAGVRDPSGNALLSDTTWTFTTGSGAVCPCTLWPPSARPAVDSTSDSSSVELGVRFRADVAGSITGIRFYKGPRNSGTHVGSLWSNTGALLARATFTGETGTGWQQVSFASPVAVTAGTTYVASYYAPAGGYSLNDRYFVSTYRKAPLSALADGVDGRNGVYRYVSSPSFPTDSYRESNYWVDVVFDTTVQADREPPQVASVSPAPGAGDVGAGDVVNATFSESIDAATVTPSTFTLRAQGGAVVPAAISYNGTSSTATLDPQDDLSGGIVYTATLAGGPTGIRDVAGNPLATDFSWSFTAKGCPCSIWSNSAAPATPATSDGAAVELGVRFKADVGGRVTGIRFYKGPGNTGTHVGSLWTNGGSLLARATFVSESTSGWQEVSFATPVPITAGTSYVASYFAPAGHYALNLGFFRTSYSHAPLTALGDGVDGANGLYRYGSSPDFPTSTYGASNYWVDVIFDVAAASDTQSPSVVSTAPASNATGISVTTAVTATFSESLDPATVSGSTVELRDATGTVVPASISYDSAGPSVKLVPSAAMQYGTRYTAVVKGGAAGVKDVAGNALVGDVVWSFDTKSCPCHLFDAGSRPASESSSDAQSVELGVKFQPERDGFVTAVRFYKGSANGGVHVGSLWTSTGVLLGRTTFQNESASGWQESALPTPVAVSAGTTYVVSYHAPAGGYAYTLHFFDSPWVNSPLRADAGANGVFGYSATPVFPTDAYASSNYWVDVAFSS
jgi:hypothetical protein